MDDVLASRLLTAIHTIRYDSHMDDKTVEELVSCMEEAYVTVVRGPSSFIRKIGSSQSLPTVKRRRSKRKKFARNASSAHWIHVLLMLVIRIIAVFQLSYLDPDEFFQAGDPVVRPRDGLTWEWARGLRSILHPALIAPAGLALHPWGRILVARLIQLAVTLGSDLVFLRFRRLVGLGTIRFTILVTGNILALLYGCRTYANALEAALVLLSVSFFPLTSSVTSSHAFAAYSIAGVCCWIRPTSAVFFLALFLMSARPFFRHVALGLAAVPGVLLTCGGAEYLYYGRIVIPPLEFIKFNVLEGNAAFYGTNAPWYFLAVAALAVWPIFLAPTLPKSPAQRKLFLAALVTVGVLSLSPHKEMRFILPVIPFLAIPVVTPVGIWKFRVTGFVWIVWTVVLFSVYGFLQQAPPVLALPSINQCLAAGDVAVLAPCHSIPEFPLSRPLLTLKCDPPPSPAREDAVLDDPALGELLAAGELFDMERLSCLVMYDSVWSQVRPSNPGLTVWRRWEAKEVLPDERRGDLVIVRPLE
ncbi:GPI mannosyltransferase [Carpediemonas membranifera]|uniref:Mannosyltransferase n=1 Tax=Carpediemonas membranifera TaxID=201153 RepID=A0A8J6BTY3_9EUKA|nr:GPI mannosyltransferase [Carpediemonas membranifera]|eukprot:KAG9389796.1 GPI mannosyltransferase [Carpediemonas membranifera]